MGFATPVKSPPIHDSESVQLAFAPPLLLTLVNDVRNRTPDAASIWTPSPAEPVMVTLRAVTDELPRSRRPWAAGCVSVICTRL